MRFTQYKYINELFKTTLEAVSYMQYNSTDELCQSCVQSLDAILNSIDNSAPINNPLSELKELFNNNIYDDDEITILCDIIKKYLQNEIKYKLKILFIAELGGKWDAMSSVYEAFISKNNCDVDVVMEPIFRSVKLENGQERRDVIYEDYLTELGIKFYTYDKYDISRQLPDITIISQPYESVTLPMFWPENIAKYSKLVYLPYFTALILNDNISSAMTSFFKLNTQKYSWKIACQSEVMKNLYKVYGSKYGKNVIETGLPKWDYPLKLNCSNTPCPEEWKTKIANKKVFLLNTHFDIQNIEEILGDSGQNFFKSFTERNDIALIWRPHPMTASIIKVYKPELIEPYNKLIDAINKSDNLIIDTFKSYSYSFVWSDALITCFSSLMEQFMLTGKPCAMYVFGDQDYIYKEYLPYKELFDFSKINIFTSLSDTIEMVNQIINGSYDYSGQKTILNKHFNLADGHAGSRVCEELITNFYNEFKYIYDTETDPHFLIIGNEKDSTACLKHFSDTNINFSVCREFYPNDNNGYKSSSVLNAEKFDYIVITQKNAYTCEKTKEYLLRRFNISENQIIIFWKLYNAGLPIMVCDRIMSNPKNDNINGIILGISHTETGIIPKYMNENWCNLAVSSQDLFFQMKTLEYCINNYRNSLSDLKYAVIDLYDYHYFNFDTSMSNSALKYLSYGGFNIDPHNIEKNKKISNSFEEINNYFLSLKSEGISEIDIENWNRYFNGIFESSNFTGFCSNYDDLSGRIDTVSEKMIDQYEYKRSTVNDIYNNTIKENINNLERIFSLLTSINPDIKIYTVVIPMFRETEIKDYKKDILHKERFNSIVSELKKKYCFTHLDFKEHSDLSNKKYLYYDAARLNYFGAIEFTNMLNNIIFNNN